MWFDILFNIAISLAMVVCAIFKITKNFTKKPKEKSPKNLFKICYLSFYVFAIFTLYESYALSKICSIQCGNVDGFTHAIWILVILFTLFWCFFWNFIFFIIIKTIKKPQENDEFSKKIIQDLHKWKNITFKMMFISPMIYLVVYLIIYNMFNSGI